MILISDLFGCRFTTISTQNVAVKSRDTHVLSLKIQSEEGMRKAHRRRRAAIRRCLAVATTQLLLNMPNYVLQVVDEFTGLRNMNGDSAIMYLYSDACLYILYMLQFPFLAVFVRLLHSNYDVRYVLVVLCCGFRENVENTVGFNRYNSKFHVTFESRPRKILSRLIACV